ncbi:hypothetical protein NDAWWUGD_CDS0045 [Salmonella phage SeKF_80]
MKVYVLETMDYDELIDEFEPWEFQGVYLLLEMAEHDAEVTSCSDFRITEYEVICPS